LPDSSTRARRSSGHVLDDQDGRLVGEVVPNLDHRRVLVLSSWIASPECQLGIAVVSVGGSAGTRDERELEYERMLA
jgi:hypothetical protein